MIVALAQIYFTSRSISNKVIQLNILTPTCVDICCNLLSIFDDICQKEQHAAKLPNTD